MQEKISLSRCKPLYYLATFYRKGDGVGGRMVHTYASRQCHQDPHAGSLANVIFIVVHCSCVDLHLGWMGVMYDRFISTQQFVKRAWNMHCIKIRIL